MPLRTISEATEPVGKPAKPRWIFRPRQKAIVIALSILCIVIRLKFAYIRAAVPFQIDYEEGNVLNAAMRILNASTPYPPPGSFPYVVNPYGPIGYLLAAFGIKLFGVSLLGPRLLVLLAGIGIALLVAALAKRSGVTVEIAALSSASFLCCPMLWAWLPLLRVDLWAVFLSLLGLYVFSTARRGWQLAPSIFALALLTKHTALAAPAACLIELLATRKSYRAIQFIVVMTLVTILGVFLVGGAPIFHLFYSHPDPYRVTQMLALYWMAIERSLLLLAIVAYSTAFGFRQAPQTRLLWLYFGCCTVTALTAGKLGSNTNHFLEWTAALCILAALALNHLLETRNRLTTPFLAALAGLCVVFSFLPQRQFAHVPDRGECGQAYAFLRSSPAERILSEDVSALVLNNKEVLVSNPFVVTELGNSVRWSQGSVETLIDHRYFDLIVLGSDLETLKQDPGRWSPESIRAVGEHYQLEKTFRCLPFAASAFVPKKAGTP